MVIFNLINFSTNFQTICIIIIYLFFFSILNNRKIKINMEAIFFAEQYFNNKREKKKM